MRSWLKRIIAVVFLAAAPFPVFADLLYLTSTSGPSGNQQIYVLDTLTATIANQWTEQHSAESPIAVATTVRTTSSFKGSLGSEYTLNGTYTGTNYANAIFDGAFDATTDGTYNYLVDITGGKVYRTASDYSAATPLFSTLGFGTLGISYDASNNSLWVSSFGSPSFVGTIADYTLGGTLLSSFSTGHNENAALAYDPLDGTLWLNNRNGEDASGYTSINLEHYSTAGVLLGTENITGLTGFVNVLGGEFAEVTAVPEPSSLWFLATVLGVLVLAIHRRNGKAQVH